MPTYNPLVGWQDDAGGLIGYAPSGQNAGGAVNGYNGSVNTLADFGKAVALGAGAVFGGPLSAALGITNMIVGANTGTSPSTLNTAKQALQSLGLMNAGPSVMGPVSNDLTSANFGGKAGEIASSVERESGGYEGGPMEGAGMGGGADSGGGLGGWSMGGFTGGREGEPRGIVHGEELVLSAPAVRALGPVADELETINALATPRKGAGPRSWAEMIMMRHPEAWGVTWPGSR